MKRSCACSKRARSRSTNSTRSLRASAPSRSSSAASRCPIARGDAGARHRRGRLRRRVLRVERRRERRAGAALPRRRRDRHRQQRDVPAWRRTCRSSCRRSTRTRCEPATDLSGRELHGDRACRSASRRSSAPPACAAFALRRIKRSAAPAAPASKRSTSRSAWNSPARAERRLALRRADLSQRDPASRLVRRARRQRRGAARSSKRRARSSAWPDLHVAATTRARSGALRAQRSRVRRNRARRPTSPSSRKAFENAPGIVFHGQGIVTPRDVEGEDRVHVGRLRAEGDSTRVTSSCGSWATRRARAPRPTACRSSSCSSSAGASPRCAPRHRTATHEVSSLKRSFRSSADRRSRRRSCARSQPRACSRRARAAHRRSWSARALGRAPEPYATDSLLGLLGPTRGGPNRDLLLSCGESIACAIFAELLTSWGADAQAMTGGAGRHPHRRQFRRREDPARRPGQRQPAARTRRSSPSSRASRARRPSGAVTTLGRGGSDLDRDRARRRARLAKRSRSSPTSAAS